MGQISVDINNRGIMTIVQERHDGNITLSSPHDEYTITPGELVMLMNYYRNCKLGVEKSDYIQKAV